jgi:hypothetical protein
MRLLEIHQAGQGAEAVEDEPDAQQIGRVVFAAHFGGAPAC